MKCCRTSFIPIIKLSLPHLFSLWIALFAYLEIGFTLGLTSRHEKLTSPRHPITNLEYIVKKPCLIFFLYIFCGDCESICYLLFWLSHIYRPLQWSAPKVRPAFRAHCSWIWTNNYRAILALATDLGFVVMALKKKTVVGLMQVL
jgi:hypothetical protein